MKNLIYLSAIIFALSSCEEDSELLDYLGDANTNTMGGCTDPIACNYGEPQSNNGNNCDYSCFGCNDPAACNYSPDFSENNDGCLYLSSCDKTYVPDDNFEAYLEANNMGNGIANDDYVTTANIEMVSYLHLNSLNIADLTGIEDFDSLQTLQIYYNYQLTSLDVSNNTALITLSCDNNQLTSLDISQNTALWGLSW